jgi:phosphohistidine phosphatase SixA
MAELVLVRHAQASFGADDYDKLSDLGWRQSRWLGEYFAERGAAFDHVMLVAQRHAQTWMGSRRAWQRVSREADARLNEYGSDIFAYE